MIVPAFGPEIADVYTDKTLFAQLVDFLAKTIFTRIVNRHEGDRSVNSLSCAQYARVMAFAQFDYRESPREIEVCLAAQSTRLYHMSFKQPIRRATLAGANARRNWGIYADFAQRLIAQVRTLYANTSPSINWDGTAYALESTAIDLYLSLFLWAPFQSTESAVKVHALRDLKSRIPSFIHISDGRYQDVNVLDTLLVEPDAIYIMGRA